MNNSIKYTIVIPCFNSIDSILCELILRLKNVFETIIQENYEIILIDDCSPNLEAWKTIEQLVIQHHEVRAFKLSRNFGKPSAVLCGYQYSRGDYVIMMDDDLQHRPEDIPLLIEKKEHAIVMARFKKRQHGLFAQWSSLLWNYLIRILIEKPSHIYMSPFNLVNRQVINATLNIKSSHPMIGALFLYITRDIVMVDVKHMLRESGSSGYTLQKKISQFSNLIINNSPIVLRLVAYLGLLISFTNFLAILYLFGMWFLVGNILQGWTSLMIIILFLGGLILFSIGVVGEYLYRIINGIENRPAYVVAETLEKNS